MTTASARPDNLAEYRSKLDPVDQGLEYTASRLRQTLEAYRMRCREFGADHTELAYALGVHASAMHGAAYGP